MTTCETLFVTRLYRSTLGGRNARQLNQALEHACRVIAAQDKAGQAWCRTHGYAGYTSYGSLDDLAWRSPEMAELVELIDDHAARFARMSAFDLRRRKLKLDSLWINILDRGGAHSGHIHPHSVLSGTYYVSVPPGSSAIRFEDPRLGLMMAAPSRKAAASRRSQTFVSVDPKPGTLLLWESWLRHEVLPNRARQQRISISFNYALSSPEKK
jgi:uncharacterized protein (TIGR02466 family)